MKDLTNTEGDIVVILLVVAIVVDETVRVEGIGIGEHLGISCDPVQVRKDCCAFWNHEASSMNVFLSVMR